MNGTFLSEVRGFTPVIDALAQEVGFVTAGVYGLAWRFCQMDTGVCYVSQERMAQMMGISRASVNTHLKKLCEAGYLRDETPGLRNRPHVYTDTGRARILGLVEARVVSAEVPDSDTWRQNFDSGCQEIDMNREPLREGEESIFSAAGANGAGVPGSSGSDGLSPILTSAPERADGDDSSLVSLWQRVTNRKMTATESEEIHQREQTYGYDVVHGAMFKAGSYGGKSLAYLDKVLETARDRVAERQRGPTIEQRESAATTNWQRMA